MENSSASHHAILCMLCNAKLLLNVNGPSQSGDYASEKYYGESNG